MNIVLEHINVTLSDIDAAAKSLQRVFGWKIRWEGESLDQGRTIHIGSENSYLALYSHKGCQRHDIDHRTIGHLNHIGIFVEDLDLIESRIKAMGLKTFNHGDYEPGRRFYFYLEDNIEIEVVSYQ
jgi:predicted enzyme related to lactoylglutathione lyase